VERADEDRLLLCCLLWARDGRAAELSRYEDRVLALIGDHRGSVRQRLTADGTDGRPDEVQIIEFADRDALDGYLQDPRRAALAGERDRVIARTELFAVTDAVARDDGPSV
jgi:hypothetical protein